MTAVPMHSQVSEVVSELKAMYLAVAEGRFVKWVGEEVVASLAVVWAGGQVAEPRVVVVRPDFALGAKNSWDADHVLKGVVPMKDGFVAG